MGLLDVVKGGVTSLARSKSGTIGRALDKAGAVYNSVGYTDSLSGGRRGKVDPLSAAMGRPDPLMAYDWFCMMPSLRGLTDGATDLTWDRVEEATLPQVEFEPISNYKAGKNQHYPNHQNLGTLTCKFYEDAYATVTSYIRNWQGLIMNRETGLYNAPSVYKFPISFTLFDVAKEDAVIITYIGCWPQAPDSYQLESGSSNRLTPSVTFSVDDVTMSFAKFSAKDLASAGYAGREFPAQFSLSQTVFPTPSLGIFDR